MKVDAPRYSLEGLNIRGDVQLALTSAQRFSDRLTAGIDSGSFVRNMTVLLYGPPGTGKTEFAKHLARSLGRKLMLKRVSDIQDKYVGETEKNIQRAFAEAEEEGAVLFFDEADSFLGNREGAQRSWEISQVNEMLSRMESFKGILVCATNFEGSLDPASRRRFHFKLEFGYLESAGKRAFWDIFFGGEGSVAVLDPACQARLDRFAKLAPGDFKAAIMRLGYLDLQERTAERCLMALEEELRAKDASQFKTMGF